MTSQKVHLQSVRETEALGAFLSSKMTSGDTVFLYGDLGAGKTSFSRGFVRAFTGDSTVDTPSPSYLLTFTYSGPRGRVHHMDPYRLASGKISGVFDFQGATSQDVLLIEWPERLGAELESFIRSHARVTEIRFSGSGARGVGRDVEISSPVEFAPVQDLGDLGNADQVFCSSAGGDAAAAAAVAVAAWASQQSQRALTLETGYVLGIESSCDDTAAALICCATGTVVAEAVASQSAVHSEFGGVVPKLAQEMHARNIDATVKAVLDKLPRGSEGSEDRRAGLAAVAVTTGPGLSLCLQVGVRKALEISTDFQVPLVKVHHLEAHILVTRLPGQPANPEIPSYPFLTLLASGGHTLLAVTRGLGRHEILGGTLDDSAGEAFDKVARMLGIEKVPGGAELEKLASTGRAENLIKPLPLPLHNTRDQTLRTNCDFSFAGLKTAVRMSLERAEMLPVAVDAAEAVAEWKADVAAAFQERVVQHLVERTRRAIEWSDAEIRHLVLAGGVAANTSIRSAMETLAHAHGLKLCVPATKLCADNGVMVAWAGIERLRCGLYDEPLHKNNHTDLDKFVEVLPRWPLGPKDSRSIGKVRVPEGRNPKKRPAAEIETPSSL